MPHDLLSNQSLIVDTGAVDSSHNPITTGFYSVKTEGDGNCGLNLFAQKMRELAEFNELSRMFDHNKFVAFRRHLLTSLPKLKTQTPANPYIAEFVALLTHSSNLTLEQFGVFLKKAKTVRQIQEMQFALAPALRAYMNENHHSADRINLCSEDNLSENGAYAPDEALASLATTSNFQLYIIQPKRLPMVGELNSPFIISKYNNVPASNPSLYIIHTGGDSLKAHWSLGLPATDVRSINFWKSISNSPVDNANNSLDLKTQARLEQISELAFAQVASILNILEQQVNELADKVIETLNESNFSAADQVCLIDHMLKKILDIYQDIELKLNNSVGDFYKKPDGAVKLSDGAIAEYINITYENAVAPYSVLLNPQPDFDDIITQLQTECLARNTNFETTAPVITATDLQQALASSPDAPKKPLGTKTTNVSLGKSPYGLTPPPQPKQPTATSAEKPKQFNPIFGS